MTKARLKSFGVALLSVGAIATVSGCGGGDPNLERGQDLFTTNCGTCHSLAAAPSNSEIGPDLDAAFATARASGMDGDTIAGVTKAQIENPRYTRDTSDPTYMPAELVTGSDADDVAAYVGSVAGVPGAEPEGLPEDPGGQVFVVNGCGACHTLAAAGTTGSVGPNLDDDLPGQSKQMIEESIVDPEAEIVQGFESGIMPEDYGDSIEPQDLKLLVDYLSENAGQGASDGGGGGG